MDNDGIYKYITWNILTTTVKTDFLSSGAIFYKIFLVLVSTDIRE